MNKELEIGLIERLRTHIADGTTATGPLTRIPTAAYTDPARLDAEARHLFHNRPLLLAFSRELPEPSSYLTHEDIGYPIAVVRGRDGIIRAFRNVCSHRGTRLLSGSGRLSRNLVCPYHNWSYDDRGSLVGVPSGGHFKELDRCQYGLLELPSVEKDGLIWVRASLSHGEGSDRRLDADEHLCGLGPELTRLGFASYNHVDGRRMELEMNWKVVIETFLEPYHFSALHSETVGRIFIGNLYLVDVLGEHLRQTVACRSISSLEEVPKSEWRLLDHCALIYLLFPNTIFLALRGSLQVWRVFPAPGSPSRSIVNFDFCAVGDPNDDEVQQRWRRDLQIVLATVQNEDFLAAATMQKNFGRGRHDHVVVGRNEPAIVHFARAVQAAIEIDSTTAAGDARPCSTT